jgi:hypothetical protein
MACAHRPRNPPGGARPAAGSTPKQPPAAAEIKRVGAPGGTPAAPRTRHRADFRMRLSLLLLLGLPPWSMRVDYGRSTAEDSRRTTVDWSKFEPAASSRIGPLGRLRGTSVEPGCASHMGEMKDAHLLYVNSVLLAINPEFERIAVLAESSPSSALRRTYASGQVILKLSAVTGRIAST